MSAGQSAIALPVALTAELRRLLGHDGVITEPGALLVYESDGLMAYRMNLELSSTASLDRRRMIGRT